MKRPSFEVKRISPEEKQALLQRAEAGTLTADDIEVIAHLFETLEFVFEKTQQKNYQLKAVLKLLAGFKSEKTRKMKNALPAADDSNDEEQNTENSKLIRKGPSVESGSSEVQASGDESQTKVRKGHGRNGSASYTGAEQVDVCHSSLKAGDNCPECLKGKLCQPRKKGVFIHITGNPPLHATVYHLQKLRCNLCGEIFKADPPLETGDSSFGSKYYDEKAISNIAILRYSAGISLYRLSQLQKAMGIPLPMSTAWDKLNELSKAFSPVMKELIRQAAQGDLIHIDDTGAKILSLLKKIGDEKKENKGKTRSGMFTTGIISKVGKRTIVLYFSGRNHAGENLAELLKNRHPDLSPPIQMGDAKSGNVPKGFEVIECCCNTHARRYFVDIAEDYPEECMHAVVDIFGKIYLHDKTAREKNLSPQERLTFHQKESGPIMDAFHRWLKNQFEEKKIEPNSNLGKAIKYVINHWDKLTRFLKIPGVPLDNNICEQALKTFILYRKNSLFFKTENGAKVGNLFMSLIQTCKLADKNPFDYLTQLQCHIQEVHRQPDKWLPWNYQRTILARDPHSSAA